MESTSAIPEKQVSTTGLMHLGVIYIVWSSTYLAIRLAVREGSGFPPFTMGTMRIGLSCILLFLWVYFRKQVQKPTRGELVLLLATGILMWSGGNGMVMYAEQHADSGLAALLLAATPLWAMVIETIIDRRLPNKQTAFSLLLGFAGITILMMPSFLSGMRASIVSILATTVSAISWSTGSVLQARKPVSLGPSMSSAYQMLGGTIGLGLMALFAHEPAPHPNIEAWLGFGYLVILGTLAFISYVTALRLLPTNLVMTYAYVNPVLAVFLGWLVLNEPITAWTIAGTVFVLLGITGVFRARRKKPQHG
jgi:drug/metabolite transporter (DMT)-like permease